MDNYDNYTPEIPENEAIPVINPSKNPKEEEPRTGNRKRGRGKQKITASTSAKEDKPVKKESYFVRLKSFFTSTSMRIVLGILLGCLALYFLVSFLSYFSTCIKDQSVINNTAVGTSGRVANAGGEGGARLAEFLINECFGLGSFVIIVWLGAMCLKMLAGKPRFKSVDFTIKCFVALITVSLIVGLSTIAFDSTVNWGGYHGRYVNEFIINFVGWTGAALLCVFMVTVFVVICLRDLVNWIIRVKRKHDEKRRIAAEEKAARLAREQELMRMQKEEHIDDIKAGESVSLDPVQILEDNHDETLTFGEEDSLYNIEDEGEDLVNADREDLLQRRNDGEDNTVVSEDTTVSEDPSGDGDATLENENSSEVDSGKVDSGKEEEKTDENASSAMVVNVNQIDQDGKRHYKSMLDFEADHKYKFPPFDLMRPGVSKISVDADEQLDNEEKIKKTLLNFGIPITNIEATVGPTVTLYEIVPDNGVKISKIRSLVDDIALSLSAIGVRIIAPIPGKGTVGIEVANKDPQTVSMQNVLRSKKFQESKYQLPIALGSTISNEVYVADLTKMPHLLVAGATGQGKSVGLNAIITSLLYSKTPSQLKFVMIDPKQVEFSHYNKLKNQYMAVIPEDADSDEPVITDMQKVEATLNSLVIEMENRYTLLKLAGVRKIEEYIEKIKENKLNPEEGHRFLPYIVVVVDEFADLIMQLKKNVEMPIARLAQKARAVGIHVILATQRPSTDVITGLIKNNFPTRISFKVSSGVDSKTILDTTGAQQLIGRGDMLIFNNSEMIRVQCAFIDTPEVENINDYISRQPYQPGPYLLPEPKLPAADGEEAGSMHVTQLDPLFEEVARRVVSSNVASTSSLQRVYSIGYNRAGKIMDQLEAKGIVGPSQGGKPRDVLVDAQMLESILAGL